MVLYKLIAPQNKKETYTYFEEIIEGQAAYHMLFNTLQYLIFLPIVALIYYFLPKQVRYIWLLIISYYFYMQWNPLYITLLFLCTLITYIGGRIIGRLNDTKPVELNEATQKHKRKCQLCLGLCIILNLGILGFFKYFDFGLSCLNRILRFIHMNEVKWDYSILLPVGISFYTLQAMGYLIDVYRNEIKAEKNFLQYALFVSFFPQLVAGPIERSKNLLVQLQESHPLDYENIRKGTLLVLYGLFLKMVIADRAAIVVNTVYEDSGKYPGFYIVVATILFSIQIYCDFYGYSTIARGSALLMGIKLMDNFEAPYYAKNIKEFWRRWHISLSGWFRDYLYIPLGGNRTGNIRKEANLFIVFAVSGLWHGASIAFILWGMLNGVYQIVSDIVNKIKNFAMQTLNPFLRKWLSYEMHSNTNKNVSFSKQLFQSTATFILITFAWLFFRAGELDVAIQILKDMCGANNWFILFNGSLYELGVERNFMNVLLISILALFIVDYQKYRGKEVADILLQQSWWFRVSLNMLLLFTILLYGCYGEIYDVQQFIYFQF